MAEVISFLWWGVLGLAIVTVLATSPGLFAVWLFYTAFTMLVTFTVLG